MKTKKIITSLLLTFSACLCLFAADKARHLNVLAVGNSYTGNTSMFPNWVEGSGKGHTLTYERIMIGGSTLEEHWQSVVMLDGGEAAKHNKTGSISKPLVMALNERNWDYVSLQHAFPQTAKISTYEPYLGNLLGLVKQYAPEAQPFFYQTWVFREDNKLYKNSKMDREEFKKAVIEASQSVAKKYAIPVMPVGEVLFKAEADFPFVRDPNFDYDNPPTSGKGPQGEKSLYAGWKKWRDIMLEDNVHTGLIGNYIVGGVWYAMLYDEKAVGNKFIPEGMSRKDALTCQRIIDEMTKGRHFPAPIPKTQEKPKQDFSKQQAILAQIKADDEAKKNPKNTMSKQEAQLIR